MKKEQYQVANLEQSSQAQPGWLFRLARPLAFLLGAALSLMAIYTFVANAQMVIRDPALVLPESTLWTVVSNGIGRKPPIPSHRIISADSQFSPLFLKYNLPQLLS